MRKVFKLIFFEVIPIFMLISLVFVIIILAEQLINIAGIFSDYGIAPFTVAKIFFYYSPSFFLFIIPIATFLAIFITYSKFSADSEIIGMYACGAKPRNIFAPMFFFSIIIMVASYFISFVLLPRGINLANITTEKALQSVTIGEIREREMYTNIEDIIFYSNKKLTKHDFEDIALIYTKKNIVITAKKAQINPAKNNVLNILFDDGNFAFYENKDQSYAVIAFKKLKINYYLPVNKGIIPNNEKLMSFQELKEKFNEDNIYKYEYYKRFSTPFGNIILSILAFFIGIYFQRVEKSSGLLKAIIVTSIYIFIQIFSATFVKLIDPVLLAWVPNILLLILALLFYTTSKGR